MLALIDSDSYCYAAAAMAEGTDEQIARQNLNQMLQATIIELNTEEYICFCTGPTNFRNTIYAEYKANRIGTQKPTFLAACKEHLRTEWKAHESVDCEADDMIGVEHYEQDCESIVVSIDKDLLQFQGLNYNPRTKVRRLISPLEGLRFFYTQLLQGDTADNIPGVKGIGKVKAAKYIKDLDNEQDMFAICRELYSCDAEMEMNAQCLWLWREMNGTWKWPEWAGPKDS